MCIFVPLHASKFLSDALDGQGEMWTQCKPLCNANYCDGWAISYAHQDSQFVSFGSSIDLPETFQIKAAKTKVAAPLGLHSPSVGHCGFLQVDIADREDPLRTKTGDQRR